MTTQDKSEKPMVPAIPDLGSVKRKEDRKGRNQYHTPTTPLMAASTEGPVPQ